jgi:hypothetical protein
VRGLLALTLAGCGGPPAETAPATFTGIREEILLPSCGFVSCHGGGAGGLTIDEDGAWDALVDVPSHDAAGEVLVIPGDADGSYLVKKLDGAEGIVGLQMPQGGELPSADRERIREWIERGAPND